jgi:hypothetical protein
VNDTRATGARGHVLPPSTYWILVLPMDGGMEGGGVLWEGGS